MWWYRRERQWIVVTQGILILRVEIARLVYDQRAANFARSAAIS
jgi:hypothetical protein